MYYTTKLLHEKKTFNIKYIKINFLNQHVKILKNRMLNVFVFTPINMY